MPTSLFGRDIGMRSPCFQTAQYLASSVMYNVSITAAAWRIVQLSRDPCALVVSHGGVVEWVARSDSFRLPLVERRQRLTPGCFAAGVAFRGEQPDGRPLPVEVHLWSEPQYPVRGVLYESTHAIPSLDQVLSLLWLGPVEEE